MLQRQRCRRFGRADGGGGLTVDAGLAASTKSWPIVDVCRGLPCSVAGPVGALLGVAAAVDSVCGSEMGRGMPRLRN